MEEKLKSALHEGEKLRWWGSAEEFDTFDKTNKPAFIRKAAVSLGIVLALIIAYVCVVPAESVKPVLILVLLAFGLIGPGNVLADAAKLKNRVSYAVTDQRLFQILDSAKGIAYTDIDSVTFKTDGDGHTSLLCGSDAIRAPAAKWRELAVVGARVNNDTRRVESFVMYAIKDAEKVKALVSEYVTVE